MLKRMLVRFINGFCYSIVITMVIQAVVMHFTGHDPMLPEYMAGFDSVVSAFITQLLLVGVMSGITSAGTIVFDTGRMGLLVQSLLFLIIMLGAWIPVACIVWGFHKYVPSMVSTICSIVVTYGICWGLRYVAYKKDIADINARLQEKKGQ